MRVFVITMLCLFGLRVAAFLVLLAGGEYPRIGRYEPWQDVITLTLALALASWAAVLL